MSGSPPATVVYPIRTFEFGSPKSLIDFLVTTQDEAELRPGTSLYDQGLNRLYLHKPQNLYVRLQTHRDLMSRLESMAKSSHGTIYEDDVVPDDARKLDINRLLRMVALKPAKPGRLGGTLLLALWECDSDDLCSMTASLWDMGANGMELAFVNCKSDNIAPTHLIRVHGLRHMDALAGWAARHERSMEVYRPMGRSFGTTAFYVLAGYQFPVPTVDRLVQINADLLLIRPGTEGGPPEWRAFGSGEIRFFRKPHEVMDLEASFHDRPLMEFDAREEEKHIPLSLALVPKPRAATQQYWQIDQEVDRLRRSLRELEHKRARLVGRDRDEVYFAYRFNQPNVTELNPLLVRLLQQRLGTLSGYDHAYCKPEHGHPFHLVLANRPCRTLGFVLQMADRIYYQPKQWRNWGVNLFLPLDTELAPLIDSNDAIPLLQRILERTSQLSDDESATGDYREWDAVLWEPGDDGNISEIRLKEKQPLLSQFRLLNSFQCQVARDVDSVTRQKLADNLHAGRSHVTDELREIERELLSYVDRQAEKIETDFTAMHGRLATADRLMTQLKPQVDEVCSRLLKAPEDWTDFVNLVIRTHRDLSQPVLDEFAQVRNTVIQVQTTLLKTLTPRGRSLVAAARQGVEQVHQRLRDFDQHKTVFVGLLQELEQLGARVGTVLVEVQQTYAHLEDRLRAVREAQEQINAMQSEVSDIREREAHVRSRHDAVKKQHAEAMIMAAETEKRQAEIRDSEEQVVRLTTELCKLKIEQTDRANRASARMEQLALQLAKVRQHSESMQELSKELNEQAGFVDRHAEAVELWQQYSESWALALKKRRDDLSATIGKMEQVLAMTQQRSSELEQLSQDTSRLRMRIDGFSKREFENGHA